uniref:Protein Nef n=1 Tax=Human immunodeficiency virus type 1 TaxID=11676 RepID=A0A0B5GL87_HV1|nr:nef protein [Human immunodeficiency virus 1]
MGGKWSKRSAPGWNTIRERMRRTEPRRTEPAAEGVGAVSRDLEREGLIHSQRRQDILDLWIYHTQGYFPDWQNYTPGPGVRYPLTFGWCFKLVPVKPEEVEEATVGENNSLLHPMNLHGMDDPEGEVLMWKFDSRLAFHHMAREKHPEYFKNC